MATIYQNRSALATDPIRNFRFLVSFAAVNPNATNLSGITTATMGFTSVSGLAVTTDSIPYREGGYNTTVHQLPGQTSFSPITLSKGVMLGDSSQAAWMKRLFSVVSSGAKAGIGADFRCDLDIRVLSHPNPAGLSGADATLAGVNSDTPHVAIRFRVYNAWITNLSYSNLDAGGNSLMVEEMTLVHEGWDAKYATALTAAGSAAAF